MRKLLSSSHCDATDQASAGLESVLPRRRNGAGRWVLAVLVGCVALLVAAPVAAAATGKIKGTVTDAVTHTGLVGVGVTVYSSSGEFVESVSTKAGGGYEAEGLTERQYKVKFSDEPAYAAQYYNDQSSLASANLVSVEEAKTTENINAALKEPGKISGRVTNASGTPLSGVTVYVYSSSEEFHIVELTFTNGNGEYTVEGLPEGSYKVGFFAFGTEYVPQYYNGQSSFASANSIAVSAGATATGINAALKEPSKISGTVTDAVTHGGLAKIGVYAFSANPEAEGYSSGSAETNASGAYTVTGLRSGSYKVEFYWVYSEAERKACEHAPQCPPKYILQYFNDQPSEATANTVGASEGSVTSGINAAMVPAAPVNTALPVVSGTPTVGDLLACSNGSWTGESEQKLSVGWPLTTPFTYQWLRDGGPIAGATTAAYVVQAVDVGHGLVCEVAATNDAGHASAKSNPVAVTPPAVTLSSTKIVVSGGSARVPIACANATCAGTIELTGQVAVKGKGKKKAKKKTVVLAKGSYSLAAGKKGTIAVRLTAAGRSALAKAKRHKLSGKAVVSVTGGKTVQMSVVLSETKMK